MHLKQRFSASLALLLAACGPSGGDGKGGHGGPGAMPPARVSVITVAPKALRNLFTGPAGIWQFAAAAAVPISTRRLAVELRSRGLCPART